MKVEGGGIECNNKIGIKKDRTLKYSELLEMEALGD